MLYNTTYTDKRTTKKINEAVGVPYSFYERFRMGGIGSKRMTIHEISEEYQQYLKAAHYDTTANLELRPKGIIVHFRHKLENYAWVMPYSSLVLDKSAYLRLESERKFISFHKDLDQSFIKKLQKAHQNFRKLEE